MLAPVGRRAPLPFHVSIAMGRSEKKLIRLRARLRSFASYSPGVKPVLRLKIDCQAALGPEPDLHGHLCQRLRGLREQPLRLFDSAMLDIRARCHSGRGLERRAK